jgi:1-deoxy-D-xylulose-5-phosphate synthase
MQDRPVTPLLDRVRIPSDMRNLSNDQLKAAGRRAARETISAVSVTGGTWAPRSAWWS